MHLYISRVFIKKLLASILVIIGIVILLVVLDATGLVPLRKFKTVTYNNGQNSFRVTFYSQYSKKKILGSDGNYYELVAKHGQHGLPPLEMSVGTLSINSSLFSFFKIIGQDVQSKIDLTGCNGSTSVLAFTVMSSYTKSNINVCQAQQTTSDSQVTPPGFVAIFRDNLNPSQDIFVSLHYSSDAYAKESASQQQNAYNHLLDYQADATKIISSVAPANEQD